MPVYPYDRSPQQTFGHASPYGGGPNYHYVPPMMQPGGSLQGYASQPGTLQGYASGPPPQCPPGSTWFPSLCVKGTLATGPVNGACPPGYKLQPPQCCYGPSAGVGPNCTPYAPPHVGQYAYGWPHPQLGAPPGPCPPGFVWYVDAYGYGFCAPAPGTPVRAGWTRASAYPGPGHHYTASQAAASSYPGYTITPTYYVDFWQQVYSGVGPGGNSPHYSPQFSQQKFQSLGAAQSYAQKILAGHYPDDSVLWLYSGSAGANAVNVGWTVKGGQWVNV